MFQYKSNLTCTCLCNELRWRLSVSGVKWSDDWRNPWPQRMNSLYVETSSGKF